MNWGTCLLLALVVALASADESEVRERRQSHPGGPQQFTISRPPTNHQQFPPQLIARGPPQVSPVAFQLLQGYRQESSPSPIPVQQYLRPTPNPPVGVTRTRAPEHIAPSPTPRPQQSQQAPRRPPPPQQQQKLQQRGRLSVTRDELADELTEEELEEEKPDRLTELLPLSKFDCGGRGTGYYADEELDCEVFHYCQAGAKHSWICPEGFTFHQVHLICMPPGGDNICKKSSQFHFVNEYLYRPINVEEAQTKPNVTLRYADRYYPENYHDTDDLPVAYVPQQPQRHRLPAPPPQRTSTRIVQQPQQVLRPQPTPLIRLIPQQQQFQTRPENQVFHSPEEVNIPLQHRRPVAQQRSQKSFSNYQEGDYDS